MKRPTNRASSAITFRAVYGMHSERRTFDLFILIWRSRQIEQIISIYCRARHSIWQATGQNQNNSSIFACIFRQRYNRFALMVQDRLRFIGCAAVEFYDHQEDYLKVSWVCNYSVANTRGATVYETGAAASKCPAGKDWDFPNMCFHSLLPAFEPNDRAKSPRYSDASTNRRIRA